MSIKAMDYKVTGVCPKCLAEVDIEKMQYCPSCGYSLGVVIFEGDSVFGQVAYVADYCWRVRGGEHEYPL